MTDESGADNKTLQTSEQVSAAGQTRLGFGRGKARPETNSEASPPPPTTTGMTVKWNSIRSQNSGATHNNKNDENNPSYTSGGFALRNNTGISGRSGFNNGGRSGFSLNYDNNSRECYNCHKTGHISRDCPEAKKDNYGSTGHRSSFNSNGARSGFNSGGGNNRNGFQSTGNGFHSNSSDRNINLGSSSNDGSASMSITVSNQRNQSDTGSKPSFNTWGKGPTHRTETRNDYEDSNKNTTFANSSSHGGFRGGHDGHRGGFNSADRGFRGGGAAGNCYNCNKPGHQSRECPEERKPQNTSGSGFSHGGSQRYSNQTSVDNFNSSGGRPTERYIPPPAPTDENEIFGEALTKGENFGKYHTAHVQCTPLNKVKPIELFEEANLGMQVLSNIRRALSEEPTAIQRYTIPCIRQQDDIMACAQTGSGKTAAFLVPIISNLLQYHVDDLAQKHNPPAPLCLIVSPTRELAIQTEHEARKFAFDTLLVACSVVGGHDMFTSTDRLREGCHIVSATTGRLKDMVEKGRLSLKKVKYFVFDEADRMLDTGFEPDIRKLEDLGLPPKDERYTSMFSATFPREVQNLAKHFLRDDYVFLAVGTPGGANEDITQTIELVQSTQKKERLFQLLEQNLKKERCLIFVETKRAADYIGTLLSQKKFMSTTMHGDRTQQQRNQAVQDFRNGKCPILVATSVAARGLDFPLIGYVVNYDLPDTSDFYVHRIGRTGRAGHLGKSISFFDADRESDRRIAPELVIKLKDAGQTVPDFLKQYAEGSEYGQSSGNTDMRTGPKHFANRNQAAGPTGGTASAGGAQESWD